MCSIGDYVKAKEYCEEAIAIIKEIGHREEVTCCLLLGRILFKDGECVKADEQFVKALAISEDIGYILGHFQSLEALASVRSKEGKNLEATLYLLTAVEKCEKMRDSLRDNDHWKISFTDSNISLYDNLCRLLCKNGNPELALYVLELGKARALTDLMSARFSVTSQVSANPETWTGIETIIDRELNCSCLYVSYSLDRMYFWILKRNELSHFRLTEGKQIVTCEGRVKNLDDFFATKSFRSFGRSP